MKRAVVIGGGIAGLAAAKALAGSFAEVIILEKDESLGSSAPRRSAAQGAHLHVLLGRGQEILSELFPEVAAKILDSDCPRIDWAADTQWEMGSGCFPRHQSGVITRSFTRPYLESLLVASLRQKSAAGFQTGQVTSLSLKENKVSEVHLVDGSSLSADLVVLAGGQYFPLERMLPGLEIAKNTESHAIDITYRSVFFRADSLQLENCRQYYHQFSPPHQAIGGVITPVENGMAVATIIQHGPFRAGGSEFADFLALAARVPGGQFLRIVRKAQAHSPMEVFHKPTMYLRRLHQVRQFPKNLFVVGDVFCSLNPVFGQGMTTALSQALLLKHAAKLSNSSDFHRRSAERLKIPFLLSELGSRMGSKFPERYLRAFLLRAQSSARLHKKFLKVLHLQAPLHTLFDLPSACTALREGTP
jgi:2-polyprenyl-6-methoxyphenol hydroxylase-like FAD-dependent oxidoreductase